MGLALPVLEEKNMFSSVVLMVETEVMEGQLFLSLREILIHLLILDIHNTLKLKMENLVVRETEPVQMVKI